MLTSSNDYLRPEYLSPLGGNFDANKSPLALLAKTCSSIGADTPSLKSLTSTSTTTPTTGSSSSSTSSSNGSTSSERRSTPKAKSFDEAKLNFKPYDINGRHRSGENETKGVNGKHTPSHGSKTSCSSSPKAHARHSPDGKASQSSNSSAPLSYTSLGLPDMHKDSLAAFYKAYGLFSPNCCPSTGSPLGAAASPYLMPPPITLDKTGAYPSIYPPAHSATAAAAAMSAMYNYARVKDNIALVSPSPSSANPLLCRDPYCAGACGQYGLHANSHAALLSASAALRESAPKNGANSAPCTPATCPNGCNQCEHQRYMAAIAAAAAYGQPFPGLGQNVANAAAAAAAAAAAGYPMSYASSLAAAAALHQRNSGPAAANNVCNWIVGDQHCGKRFGNSEELLQHLKTHAVLATSAQAQAELSSERNTSQRSTPTTPQAKVPSPATGQHYGGGSAASPQSARLSGSSPSSAHHSNRYHPYSKSSVPPPHSTASTTTNGMGHLSAMLYGNGGGLVPGAPPPPGPYPFGTPMPASLASSLYYPYMSPGLFSSRIGPPVPP